MWLQPRSLTRWLFRLYAGVTSILMTPCVQADGELFDRFTLDVGLVPEPTVVPAFVTGGDISDIVVIVQLERHRQVSIYRFGRSRPLGVGIIPSMSGKCPEGDIAPRALATIRSIVSPTTDADQRDFVSGS